MEIRPLWAQFSMRRQDVTVAFCNFENAIQMDMTGNVARITSLVFVVTRLMEFSIANARLRRPPFTNLSMSMDPISIHITAVRSPVPQFLHIHINIGLPSTPILQNDTCPSCFSTRLSTAVWWEKRLKTIRWGIIFKMYLTEKGQDVAQCVNLNKDTIKRHWRFPYCIKNDSDNSNSLSLIFRAILWNAE